MSLTTSKPTKLEGLRVKPNYTEEVYRVLVDAISDGTLAPGVRVIQEEIATVLQVSRSPVLQAMQLLKKDGLLQDAEGRGLIVAPLEIKHIRDLYEVRSVLESLAAKLAAEKSVIIDKALFDNGIAAVKKKDVRAMIEADEAFHRAIYEASGNPQIWRTLETVWVSLRRIMGLVLKEQEPRDSIWEEHRRLAEAIESGNVDLAVELSSAHMNKSRAMFLDELEEILEP